MLLIITKFQLIFVSCTTNHQYFTREKLHLHVGKGGRSGNNMHVKRVGNAGELCGDDGGCTLIQRRQRRNNNEQKEVFKKEEKEKYDNGENKTLETSMVSLLISGGGRGGSIYPKIPIIANNDTDNRQTIGENLDHQHNDEIAHEKYHRQLIGEGKCCYVNPDCVDDSVVLEAEGRLPGGIYDREIPKQIQGVVNYQEQDNSNTKHCGEGGDHLEDGTCGCIVIRLRGFYNENIID